MRYCDNCTTKPADWQNEATGEAYCDSCSVMPRVADGIWQPIDWQRDFL